jgi:fatty acid desaturase
MSHSGLASTDPDTTSDDSSPDDYATLRRMVHAAGLLNLQPVYYAWKSLVTLGPFVLSYYLAVTVDNIALLVLAAVLVGITAAQVGLLGHDIGHRQVVRNRRLRHALSLVTANLLLGVSYTWWTTKHNAHHSSPNQVGKDPDINFATLAFSESQTHRRSRVSEASISIQAYLFPLMLLAQSLNMRFHTIQHLRRGEAPYRQWELLSLLGHYIIYGIVLAQVGGLLAAITFAVIHHAVLGVYNGLVFAPNHKGMLMLEPGERLDFLREQVLTARNVRPNPLIDFIYGGLNYQIEHHLFQDMPRNRLHEVRPMVQKFCSDLGIAYEEVGFRQAYVAIAHHLHDIGKPLRHSDPPTLVDR